jgi:flagellar basal body-associated protein FliL
MTAYTMTFLFILLFTLAVGIGAIFFISFDEKVSNQRAASPKRQHQSFNKVRLVTTDIIETVDTRGTVQRWKRSSH